MLAKLPETTINVNYHVEIGGTQQPHRWDSHLALLVFLGGRSLLRLHLVGATVPIVAFGAILLLAFPLGQLTT